MIDWEATAKELGRTDLSGNRPKVVMKCDQCGSARTMEIRHKSKVNGSEYPWVCGTCLSNRPDRKEKSRQAALTAWQDPEYQEKLLKHLQEQRDNPEFKEKMKEVTASQEFKEIMTIANRKKVTPESRKKNSESSKKLWDDPEYKERMSKMASESNTRLWEDPDYIAMQSAARLAMWRKQEYRDAVIAGSTAKWQDPEYSIKMLSIFASDEFRNKMSEVNKAVWARPGYKEKMISVLANARFYTPKVSSIQRILYSILDDLGIKYFREYDMDVDGRDSDPETMIGPHLIDCVVPREGKPTLLIECNGDWWHRQPRKTASDASKASYMANNFTGVYDFKTIWEHEFGCKDKIINLIKFWMGAELAMVDFDFDSVIIKRCETQECKLLLSKYHYLPNAGRGGISYGAYLNNTLIAVCVFSHPIRQNVNTHGFPVAQVKELSRLCIHPAYQKPNFASWFVSRCLKQLTDIKLIISYCDTMRNDGAVYKACNFKLDGEVEPDYWYASEDRWVMHKRTLYRKARQMKLKEAEYAQAFGYTKRWGDKKLRFIYSL